MSTKTIEYSDLFGRSRFAQVVFERDAALAQVERLHVALETMIAWVNAREDNPVVQQARAALQGDGT